VERHRIVVVEDESIVALDIKVQLERLGHQVPAIFQSGEELLDALPGLNADLVFMDIALEGDLDGLETAQQVKERFGLPVILLTALDSQEILERAKMVQPLAFIAKPFDERDLRNAVVISIYRHTMEQTLHDRERLFSTTLESIRDGVLVTDDAYRIEYSNSVAESTLELPRDAVRGALLGDVLRLRDATGDAVDIAAAADGQLYIERSDGTTKAVDRYVAPLAGNNGARTGWVVVIHDVTERLAQEETLRRNEEQLRRSQKMEAIGRLTGGIAHDFNNLLTVILGYAKLLNEEIADHDTVDLNAIKEDLEGIQKAALRSAALTRQLLSFSRHQSHERRLVDVNEIVSDMEKLLGRLVGDDVRLHVDLLASDARVRVDPSQLEQVIMNLAVNARDAMPDGGRLAIRTEVRDVSEHQIPDRGRVAAGRFVVMVVRDTGVGMSRDVSEKVFEPFFTTKEVGQGTGLGLSTVYGIVTKSGGFIELDSEVGRGTSFTVYLPIYQPGAGERRDPDTTANTQGGSESVLLVEDEEAVRELLARVLRSKGYQVLEAANAGEAVLLQEQHESEIALLVTDVVMPHLSGIGLAERLLERCPRLRILYVSAYPESYLSGEQLRRLGSHFMQKPLDPVRFAERVRTILDE
jgi:two-component system, cell cycle sensor histidine kinase and response regulator CckA